jgi:outer membrane immunogenic protein
MKKLLLGSVALAMLGTAVNAADMRVRPLPAPVALATWTGCHIGGAVGNEWGRHDGFSASGATRGIGGGVNGRVVPAGTPITDSFSMDGFTGGFYAGCDYQFGIWVIGVEGDWSVVNKEGQAVEFTPPRPAGTIWVDSAKERWFATARARLGYAVDKWLFYVTGGAAWAKIDNAEFLITSPINTTTLQSHNRTGWTIGAGLDYALSYGWSVRTEYLFIQFNSYDTFTTGPFGTAVFSNQTAGKLTNNVWRAGLTYKFF